MLIDICPACNKKSTQFWSTVRDEEYGTLNRKEFTYNICTLCEVIFLSENLEKELSEIYPVDYYSFLPEGYNLLFRVKFFIDKSRFRKLRKYFPDSIDILDIGGGIGNLSSQAKSGLSKRQVTTTIIDLDSGAAKFAEAKGHKYLEGKFEDFLFEKKFNLILAFNIVEHVHDPVNFIKTVHKNLQDDGIAVFQTPNFNSIDARLFRKKYWGGLHAPRHFVLFSEKSFINILSDNYFEILKFERIPGGPFWAYSILGSMRRIRFDKPLYKSKLYVPLTALFTLVDFARRAFMPTSQQLIVVRKVVS